MLSSAHIVPMDNHVLSSPCHILPGVGKTLSAKLARCKILTLQDLLLHMPYRYQDKTRVTPLSDVRPNDSCVIAGRIARTEIRFGRGRILLCHIEDNTGILTLQFFHFRQNQAATLAEGAFIRAFGEVRGFGQRLVMTHPEYRILEDPWSCPVEESLTPLYPTTEGLPQRRIRQLVQLALSHCEDHLDALEWMDEPTLAKHGHCRMGEALRFLHAPPPETRLQTLEEGTHAAMQRLVLDELLAQRLCIQFARNTRRELASPPLQDNGELKNRFLAQLPFALTDAQTRVGVEIAADLANHAPMLRLVQGDVGAGKTVIAALAALQAIEAGYQTAFMAPTELLSEQHAQTFERWFSPLGIGVVRLGGNLKAGERREALQRLSAETRLLAVGTHALFQKDVDFARLGLVIIDEQHRFGVNQRLQLHEKGRKGTVVPHQLIMTATPIPRTLAMTRFAHLDVSTLDSLPPGRTPVVTAVLPQTKREPVILRLQAAITEGRQAYWVCPLIEESETLECATATETATRLQSLLPKARIGLIHGRMKGPEKDAIMQTFRAGTLDLLVATTVIEVGVDVPNASIMVIENAERLGLAQLHQLRGRVGRGSQQSHCLLLYQSPLSHQGMARLQWMRETTDGFVLAEQDLLLRGSGEFAGTRQSGYQTHRIARFPRDAHIAETVGSIAAQLAMQDPETAKALAHRWYGEQAETYILA